MQYRHRMMIVLVSLLLLAAGCTGSAPTLAPIRQEEAYSPALRTITGAHYVCSTTAQLPLQVVVDHATLGNEAGKWQLYSGGENAVIQSGIWDLTNHELIITSADGKALPAGDYEVRLTWQDQPMGSHPFTVSAIEPGITNLSISTVPQHLPLTELVEGTQHFYVNFAWVGGCENAPYRVEVYRGTELVCQHDEHLTEDSGSASQPCFLADGAALEPGEYLAVFTLMDDTEQSLAFNINMPVPPATTVPTPTPRPIECGPAFSASGITPEGDFYRPLDVYEWYVQAVYVGTACENLSPGTNWTSTWNRDGEIVRTFSGTWLGGEPGIIWDSFTGVPGDPFVFHGTYTITLEIGSTETVTTTFRVLAYPSQEEDN